MSTKVTYSASHCRVRLSRVGEKPSLFGTWTPPPPYEVTTSKQRPRRAPPAKSPRRRS